MGKFEKFTDKGGEYRFRLKASNGETILASEGYKSTSGRANGIRSVRNNCANPARYQRLESKSGKPYFNLRAGNHQVIGTSEMYESESAMENGIKSVMKNGTTTNEESV